MAIACLAAGMKMTIAMMIHCISFRRLQCGPNKKSEKK
jgi:hypothetical protein